jgi:hypothetical protein
MKTRCYNKNIPGFADYGGRGIKVHPSWRDSFAQFLSDMGPRPSALHSLDRIDNDGDYEPGNCRWALPDTQRNNTRRTRRFTLDGRTQSLMQWSRELGFDYNLAKLRINGLGWSFEDAISTPPDNKAKRTHCKHGHPLSGDNLMRISPNSTRPTRRTCRECNRIACRNRKAKKRQQQVTR